MVSPVHGIMPLSGRKSTYPRCSDSPSQISASPPGKAFPNPELALLLPPYHVSRSQTYIIEPSKRISFSRFSITEFMDFDGRSARFEIQKKRF
jgi:hypothetical protein